jgi:hypothetical protein
MGKARTMPRIRDNNWVDLRRALNTFSKLSLGPESTPTFAGLNLDSLSISNLTASRLLYGDADKNVESVSDLTAWVAGTANRVTVSNDGDGSITISGPQDIHTGASPTFANLTVGGSLNGLTAFDATTAATFDARYYTEVELGSNANALGASLIGIEDAMSLFVATDVEAALAEVKDQITIVTHVADSVAMDVGSAVGSVSDTQIIDDGNEYAPDETAGPPDPNWVATFEFSGITAGHEPNLIEINWSYDGGGGHIIELEMYNYDTAGWDIIDDITMTDSTGNLIFDSFSVADGGGMITDYTSGGAARVRFSHSGNGVAVHAYLIDYLAIKDGNPSSGGGVTDHGALSGLGDDDHTQYHTDARAATWLAANHETTFAHGDIATNSAKVTNATHSSEVTGATALTITDNVVDEANLKLDTGPTNDYVLTADSGESGGMKWAEADIVTRGAPSTLVFSTTVDAANTFQDLDISAVVGANKALVMLQVSAGSFSGTYSVKNSDYGSETYGAMVSTNTPFGVGAFAGNGVSSIAILSAMTNASGVLRHGSSDAATTITVIVVSYIVLE